MSCLWLAASLPIFHLPGRLGTLREQNVDEMTRMGVGYQENIDGSGIIENIDERLPGMKICIRF
jgi:hypothetical protein